MNIFITNFYIVVLLLFLETKLEIDLHEVEVLSLLFQNIKSIFILPSHWSFGSSKSINCLDDGKTVLLKVGRFEVDLLLFKGELTSTSLVLSLVNTFLHIQ